MVAKIIRISEPVNDSERQAIKFLRDNLPDTYTIIHNFEIPQSEEKYEIDIAIIAPHSIFIIHVKGIPGLIDIYNSKWYPEGRGDIGAPLAKCRQNAKVIKALICDAHPTKTDLKQIHVHGVILMTAPNSHVDAHESYDADDITYLNQKCLTYFKGKGHIPSHRLQDIRSFNTNIEQAIVGKARPKSAPTIYREWQIEEELGGNPDKYTEYRAKHIFLGKRGGIARLRVYEVDPYQEQRIRDRQRNLISNAYRSMREMPGHPNILKLTEFFPTEAEDKFILVIEDIPGEPLSQHIRKPNLALTFDQKIGTIRDILSALDHAHKYEVIHRNLTLDAILVTPDGNARLTGFDYARVTKNRSSTIAEDIVDDLDYNYQAPECYRDPTEASIASDLFSAGLVFYELLTGQTAFKNISQVFDCDAIFPEKPSSYKADLPAGIDEWLQKLCAFDPEERFISAAVTLVELNNIITPRSPVQPGVPKPGETLKALTEVDWGNLSSDYVFGNGNQFIVQKRLGQGGFGVVYKVFDSIGDRDLVMKLITRDRESIYQRLKREYKTLLAVPEHPHIVKVIFASKFPDETPYILFEYVDGQDVEKILETEALSLEEAVKIARQTAAGLAHLHENGVYHQDIKPSNLLWTDTGVRIIDFNVAVSERDEIIGHGGTRRYIPPDFDLTQDLDKIDRAQKSDRDLYALGITFYECITGKYPFDDQDPKLRRDKPPRDPRNFTTCKDLSDELVQFLMKAISPYRVDRFSAAKEFGEALDTIKHPRKISQPTQLTTESLPATLTDDRCPVKPRTSSPHGDCPHRIGLVVDMGDPSNPHMTELSRQSADTHYRRIPTYIEAHFITKKLDEMAEYLKTRNKFSPAGHYFSVGEVLQLLHPSKNKEREDYFKSRNTQLIERYQQGGTDSSIPPEVQRIINMSLGEFDTYIEILVALRGSYHREAIIKCLDAFLLKNSASGLLRQSRAKGSPRWFALGSRLLEVLLQIAVLEPNGTSFVTREIRVDELLTFLRDRYGLYIDRLPSGDGFGQTSIVDQQALRKNVTAFKTRLREIGFFQDLSDAYVTQTVTPRYTIITERSGR